MFFFLTKSIFMFLKITNLIFNSEEFENFDKKFNDSKNDEYERNSNTCTDNLRFFSDSNEMNFKNSIFENDCSKWSDRLFRNTKFDSNSAENSIFLESKTTKNNIKPVKRHSNIEPVSNNYTCFLKWTIHHVLQPIILENCEHEFEHSFAFSTNFKREGGLELILSGLPGNCISALSKISEYGSFFYQPKLLEHRKAMFILLKNYFNMVMPACMARYKKPMDEFLGRQCFGIRFVHPNELFSVEFYINNDSFGRDYGDPVFAFWKLLQYCKWNCGGKFGGLQISEYKFNEFL